MPSPIQLNVENPFPEVKMHAHMPPEQLVNHWSRTVAGLPFLYKGSSNGQKALVCLSPKSGSSAWSYAFLLGHTRKPFEIKLGDGRSSHRKPLPINVSLRQYMVALKLPYIPRIAIVRHPIPRLLSGYLGKVLALPAPPSWPTGYNESGPGRGTFPHFVQYVTSHQDAVHKKVHFQLQTDMCAGYKPGAAPWRFLRIEEIGTWYENVVCMLGLQHAVHSGWADFRVVTMADRSKQRSDSSKEPTAGRLPCMVRTGCGCVVDCAKRCAATTNAAHTSFRDANSWLNDYYTPELASSVNEWARNDLTKFGYKPWMPGMSLMDTL